MFITRRDELQGGWEGRLESAAWLHVLPMCIIFLRKLHSLYRSVCHKSNSYALGNCRKEGKVNFLIYFTLVCFYMQLFLHNYNHAVNRVLGLIIFHWMLHNRHFPRWYIAFIVVIGCIKLYALMPCSINSSPTGGHLGYFQYLETVLHCISMCVELSLDPFFTELTLLEFVIPTCHIAGGGSARPTLLRNTTWGRLLSYS